MNPDHLEESTPAKQFKQGDRWIIFYTDGSTFCSSDGTPWQAPRRDVQCVASSKDEKDSDFYLIQQIDYFYYEPNHGGWNDCTDLFSLHDHLLRADYPLVIFGRMLSDAQWKETFRAVKKFCEDNRQYLLGLTDDRPQKTYL